MAQVGTPSAGWYTDPSGQHRARYWDGAGWTEQVRDDVAAPNSGSGNGSANPAAATVAGVAQAVATVAEQDVVAEPPLIIDYGSDGPMPLASAPVYSLEPTPAPISAPISVPSSAPTPAPTSRPPEPEAAPAVPTPEPAPIVSGPPAGWYPDPAARHQARLWDGMRWTERVADNGVEGVDPVPGAAPVESDLANAMAATTTVAATTAMAEATTGAVDPILDDPATVYWSAQLLSGTNVDGAIVPIPEATGTETMTAGQASLATLAEQNRDKSEGESKRKQARPSGKATAAGWMVLVGAVALLAGSGMPWMQVRGPRVGYSASETGVNLGDGRITVVLAIALAVFGTVILTGRMAKVGGPRVAAMGALVAGAAAAAVTAVDIADVADRAHRLGVPLGSVTDVGTGLWLCFVGALIAVAGGLMAFANR